MSFSERIISYVFESYFKNMDNIVKYYIYLQKIQNAHI